MVCQGDAHMQREEIEDDQVQLREAYDGRQFHTVKCCLHCVNIRWCLEVTPGMAKKGHICFSVSGAVAPSP